MQIRITKNKALFQEATRLARPLYILFHKFHEFASLNQQEAALELKVVSVAKEEADNLEAPTSPKHGTEEEGEMPDLQKSKKRKPKPKQSHRTIADFLAPEIQATHEEGQPQPAVSGLRVRIIKPLFPLSSQSDAFPLTLLFKWFPGIKAVALSVSNKYLPTAVVMGGLFPLDTGTPLPLSWSFHFLQLLCGESLVFA